MRGRLSSKAAISSASRALLPLLPLLRWLLCTSRPLAGRLEHRPLDGSDPLLEAGRACPREALRGCKSTGQRRLRQAHLGVVVEGRTAALIDAPTRSQSRCEQHTRRSSTDRDREYIERFERGLDMQFDRVGARSERPEQEQCKTRQGRPRTSGGQVTCCPFGKRETLSGMLAKSDACSPSRRRAASSHVAVDRSGSELRSAIVFPFSLTVMMT